MWSLFARLPAYRAGRALGRAFALPSSLTVSVLYACNSRCKTCRVYEHRARVLEVREYDRIFASIGRAPRWVTVTGGESFLRDDLGEILASLLERFKPATASNRYRGLRAFFAWCVEEGEITRSPMEHMQPPAVPETPPEVLTESDLKRLLKTCAGKSFEDRRDSAIIWLFLDTGMRLSELTNLRLSDLDLDAAVNARESVVLRLPLEV